MYVLFHCLQYTVDQKVFVLKYVVSKNFCGVKFAWSRSSPKDFNVLLVMSTNLCVLNFHGFWKE